jgi:CheY-like chemotaxis protein
LRPSGLDRCKAFNDADDAILVLARERIDFVFVDCELMPAGGPAFVRAVRCDTKSRSREQILILLAKTLTKTSAQSARDAGANAIIGLPLSNATVIKTLEKIVAHPRPFLEGANYTGPCRRAGIITTPSNPSRRRTDRQSEFMLD